MVVDASRDGADFVQCLKLSSFFVITLHVTLWLPIIFLGDLTQHSKLQDLSVILMSCYGNFVRPIPPHNHCTSLLAFVIASDLVWLHPNVSPYCSCSHLCVQEAQLFNLSQSGNVNTILAKMSTAASKSGAGSCELSWVCLVSIAYKLICHTYNNYRGGYGGYFCSKHGVKIVGSRHIFFYLGAHGTNRLPLDRVLSICKTQEGSHVGLVVNGWTMPLGLLML